MLIVETQTKIHFSEFDSLQVFSLLYLKASDVLEVVPVLGHEQVLACDGTSISGNQILTSGCSFALLKINVKIFLKIYWMDNFSYLFVVKIVMIV